MGILLFPDSRLLFVFCSVPDLSLQKVRFQYNLIFFNLPDPKGGQLFVKIGEKEGGQLQGAFPAEFFYRDRIHMAQGKVKGSLAGKSQSPQIGAFWEDVPELDMFVFQGTLLAGLHGVTVEYACPPGAVGSRFHCIGGRKFCTPVGEQDMGIFPEKGRAQDGLEKVNAVFHRQSGLRFLVNAKKEPGINKLEGLDKGAAGLIVIDGVHLDDGDVGVV